MSSPMRLLHLCYGKRCEYRSCNNTINLVRPEFGMFYCSDCLTRYGTQDVSSHRNVDFFLIDRAAKQYKKNDSRRIIVWKRNLCDISGERIGPVINLEMVNPYINSKKGSSWLSLGSHREEILVSSLRAVSSSLLLEPFQKALSKANKIALLAFLVLQSQHHFYMTRYVGQLHLAALSTFCSLPIIFENMYAHYRLLIQEAFKQVSREVPLLQLGVRRAVGEHEKDGFRGSGWKAMEKW
eukprot:gene29618-39276_t